MDKIFEATHVKSLCGSVVPSVFETLFEISFFLDTLSTRDFFLFFFYIMYVSETYALPFFFEKTRDVLK